MDMHRTQEKKTTQNLLRIVLVLRLSFRVRTLLDVLEEDEDEEPFLSTDRNNLLSKVFFVK